jgi:hypothetical protein
LEVSNLQAEGREAEEKQSAFTVTLQLFEESLPDKQRPNS